jgi:hypothetical protein
MALGYPLLFLRHFTGTLDNCKVELNDTRP